MFSQCLSLLKLVEEVEVKEEGSDKRIWLRQVMGEKDEEKKNIIIYKKMKKKTTKKGTLFNLRSPGTEGETARRLETSS
jgi:hypothetical protein